MTMMSLRFAVALGLGTCAAAQTAPAPSPAASSASAAPRAESSRLAIPIGGRGSLELLLPADWRHELQQPPGGAPPTVQIFPLVDPMSGGILVTPLWVSEGKGESISLDQVRGRLDIDAEDLGPGAKPVVRPLAETNGAWFTHRDPAAPRGPGDFEYMTRVHVGLGDVDLTATILAHVEDSAARKAGLALLASARIIEGSSAPIPVSMMAPGANWLLRVDLPRDFAVSGVRQSEPPGAITVEGRTADGWNFTAFMEPNPEGKTAAAWRDGMAERARKLPTELAAKGVTLGEVKTWEDGARAGLTYSLAAPGNMSFRSWNLVLVREKVWIDIHLSRSPHVPADQTTFDAIAHGVRFEGGSK